MRRDSGFTLVELMVVVLIIAVLLAVAIPVYASSRANAERATCFANQRVLEGAAQTWRAENGEDISDLEGVINGTHPLVDSYILRQPPTCPAAPQPADVMTVDVAHGAYTFDDDGSIEACTHGSPEHGAKR